MIRHVIFDLSEVLLPGIMGIETRLEQRFGLPCDTITRALGIRPHYEVGNVLDKLLTGEMSYEAYRDAFLSAAELPQSSASVFDEVCLSMFASPYDYTEQLLATVAGQCELFLLSDHCEPWAAWITSRHSFLSSFKDIVWSYEVGATKRSPEPFKHILDRNNLDPRTCLFVDDGARNVRMARSLRLEAVHFEGPGSIEDVYAAAGIASPQRVEHHQGRPPR